MLIYVAIMELTGKGCGRINNSVFFHEERARKMDKQELIGVVMSYYKQMTDMQKKMFIDYLEREILRTRRLFAVPQDLLGQDN